MRQNAARGGRGGMVVGALKRTDVREDDVLQVRRVFDEIDEDKSGVLSLRELISFSVTNPRAIPNVVFKNLVTDEDGQVTFEELLRCHFPKCSAATIKEAIERWAPQTEGEETEYLAEEAIDEIRQIYSVFRPDFEWDYGVFTDEDEARPQQRRVREVPAGGSHQPQLTASELAIHLCRTGLSAEEVKRCIPEDGPGTLSEEDFIGLMREYYVTERRGIGLYSLQSHTKNIRWSKLFPAASGGKAGGPEDYFKPPYFWPLSP
eukprot:Hpha_TRINITY_DN8696_c0_g1::TRINITY_DN8696_c0_g1_i1::g.168730::m.168730